MSHNPNESAAEREARRAQRLKDTRPRDPEGWVHRSMNKYRRAKNQLAFRPDETFFELADSVITPEHTLLGYDRLYVFWQAIRNLTQVPGDMIEVGSYRGGSAYFIAASALGIIGEQVPMRVVDTFEGHPESAISGEDPFHKPGQFHRTSYDRVRALLEPFPNVTVHQSDVLLLLPQLPEAQYRLVHIDTDLYQPTVACLDYFAPRLSKGAVVVIDDYASPKCPGVPKAVAEFMQRADGFQAWDVRTEQLVLVKS
jgi:O-methyltransferase